MEAADVVDLPGLRGRELEGRAGVQGLAVEAAVARGRRVGDLVLVDEPDGVADLDVDRLRLEGGVGQLNGRAAALGRRGLLRGRRLRRRAVVVPAGARGPGVVGVARAAA